VFRSFRSPLWCSNARDIAYRVHDIDVEVEEKTEHGPCFREAQNDDPTLAVETVANLANSIGFGICLYGSSSS
jgi:hypothetical protein